MMLLILFFIQILIFVISDDNDNIITTSLSKSLLTKNIRTEILVHGNSTRRSLQEKPKVGVFTPFGIGTGYGECYVFAAVSAFKLMGYDIDIITFEDAECVENTCIEQNLRSLRISLTTEDFDLHLISEDSAVYNDAAVYDIFFTMGIKKLPQIPMIPPEGRYLNIYFCQFPFDWLRGGKDFDRKTDIWASYDYVLVNSKYTYNWYGKATIPWIHRGLHRGVFTPTLTLIYHPVLPLKLPENTESHSNHKIDIESQLSKLPDNVINIAYVGSFTVGDNTPAHSAIRLFNKLVNSPQTTEKNINLFIMGKVTSTAQLEQFSNNLYGNITSIHKNKVKLMLSASNEEISNVLNTCLILWDLQYINPQPLPLPTPPFGDPFPVGILEAMFNGVIPISVDLASLSEIITPNFNGFLGLVDDDFIARSLHILTLNEAQINRFRLNSIKTAHSFGLESFQKCLTVFTKDAIKHDILFELSRKRLKETWDIPLITEPQSTGFIAVLLAPSIYGTLELEFRNVVSYLGQGWAIQVHHGKENRDLLKIVLGGVPNVQYVELKMPLHTDDDYNRLLKSESFWTQFKEEEKILLFTLDSYLLRFGIRDYIKYDYVAPPLPVNILAKYNLNPDGTLISNSTSSSFESKKKKKSFNDMMGTKSKGSGSSSKDRRQLVNAYVNTHHYRASNKDDTRPTAASISFRSVKSMLSIIKAYGKDSPDSEPEAIFFLREAVKMNLIVPKREFAYSFAVQYECSDIKLSQEPPIAIHLAWKYYDYAKVSEWVNNYVIRSTKKVAPPSLPTPPTTPVVSNNINSKEKQKTEKTETIKVSVGDSSPIDKVWGLLNNNDFVNDPVKLKSIFDKSGVEEASDLKLLDEPVIISIAELLKPIPKKKFLLALGK